MATELDSQYRYLLSLESVRNGAKHVYEAAKLDELKSFDFQPEKLDSAAELVCSIITASKNI